MTFIPISNSNSNSKLSDIEDVANTIADSDYGIHAVVVYRDSDTLKKFYSYYVKKKIDEKKNKFVWLHFMKH